LLKMTSLNASVIFVRLIVSLFIQRLLGQIVGESGIARVGSLRNLVQILTSITTLGLFNGIVKYLAEYKEDKPQLQKLFSTTFVFTVIGSLVSAIVLLFFSDSISNYLFYTKEFSYLIKLMALVAPTIALQRVFNGVVNGLSAYKKFAKIDLFGYLLSAVILIFCLLYYNIDGVLIAIAFTPLLQLLVLLFIFGKELKEYVQFKKLSFKVPMAKGLLAFSLMSFFSTVLLNYIEIDIRGMIENKITERDAGIWTAMTNISKNYMVFSTALFSLYVLPKFSGIQTKIEFKKELLNIYKTLLPIFGIGMFLVYVFRDVVVEVIYPDFEGLSDLFKWQVMGDFVRLASLILLHQLIAKKLVRNFIFIEVLSITLFYVFAYYFTDIYGLQGVVLGHFLRYIIYFFVVLYLVIRHFNSKKFSSENTTT
jgi:O-antigen/teichoic acid export membrane protein